MPSHSYLNSAPAPPPPPPLLLLPFLQPAAVKIISKRHKTEQELALLQREIEIMARINHPNCVSYYAREDGGERGGVEEAEREGEGGRARERTNEAE
jgi:serine/threonine protein kinase